MHEKEGVIVTMTFCLVLNFCKISMSDSPGSYHIINPDDSGRTPARSICLKSAGPTIRITRHLLRSFLE